MSNNLARLRLLAFSAQQGLCYYCGHAMWLPTFTAEDKTKPARYRCTAEHLIAVSDGGRTTQGNIVAACLYCNTTRHRAERPLSPLLYRARVLRRLQLGYWHGHR